jgi:hypothetical protein
MTDSTNLSIVKSGKLVPVFGGKVNGGLGSHRDPRQSFRSVKVFHVFWNRINSSMSGESLTATGYSPSHGGDSLTALSYRLTHYYSPTLSVWTTTRWSAQMTQKTQLPAIPLLLLAYPLLREWLPSRCLAMNDFSGSDNPVFRFRITISYNSVKIHIM